MKYYLCRKCSQKFVFNISQGGSFSTSPCWGGAHDLVEIGQNYYNHDNETHYRQTIKYPEEYKPTKKEEVKEPMLNNGELKQTIKEVKEAFGELVPSTKDIVVLFVLDHLFLGGEVRKALVANLKKLLEKLNKND